MSTQEQQHDVVLGGGKGMTAFRVDTCGGIQVFDIDKLYADKCSGSEIR